MTCLYIRILYVWNDKYWKWKLCFCAFMTVSEHRPLLYNTFFLIAKLNYARLRILKYSDMPWSIVTGPYQLMKPPGASDKRKFTWKRSCLTSYGNRYFMDCFISQRSHGTQWSWNLITYLYSDKGMGLTNSHKGTKVTVPKTETAALVLCELCNEHTITGLRVIIELRPQKFYRDGGI